MARKRPSIGDDLFRPTGRGDEPQDEPQERPAEASTEDPAADVPADGYTRPISVGLKDGELRELDTIAETEGVARNAIMRYAIRYFIAMHQAGQVQLPVQEETTKRVAMPRGGNRK